MTCECECSYTRISRGPPICFQTTAAKQPAGGSLSSVHAGQGESGHFSDMSSYDGPPSPLSAASSGTLRVQTGRGPERLESCGRQLPLLSQHFLPSDPGKWNVEHVYEFICSLPGGRYQVFQIILKCSQYSYQGCFPDWPSVVYFGPRLLGDCWRVPFSGNRWPSLIAAERGPLNGDHEHQIGTSAQDLRSNQHAQRLVATSSLGQLFLGRKNMVLARIPKTDLWQLNPKYAGRLCKTSAPLVHSTCVAQWRWVHRMSLLQVDGQPLLFK